MEHFGAKRRLHYNVFDIITRYVTCYSNVLILQPLYFNSMGLSNLDSTNCPIRDVVKEIYIGVNNEVYLPV